MSADEFGRNGREWRFCATCQRPDALVWRKLEAGKPDTLQCRFCHPFRKPAPAPEGIFA
jgi:hypothetical protein